MTDVTPDLDGLEKLAKAVIESKAAFMNLPEEQRSIGVPFWWHSHRAYADALTPEATLALIALARRAVPGGGEDDVERLSKVYAEATGYYVPFHRGLSSPSADSIRKGIRAVLAAIRSPE